MTVNTARSDLAATLCGMNKDEIRRKEQGERLKAARQEAGYRSAREAALTNGWPESTYRAHEGGKRTIGQDDAEKYARRFKVSSAREILFGTDSGPHGVSPASAHSEPERTPDKASGIEREPQPNVSFPPRYQRFPEGYIPVLGQTVTGPNGRFIMNGQEVDQVFVPPGLDDVEGAYAVRVFGTSMLPRLKPGMTVWLNPKAIVKAEDDVVVQVRTTDGDGLESYLKEFVSRSSTTLRLKQLNPGKGEQELIEFDMERVFSVHKVVFYAPA